MSYTIPSDTHAAGDTGHISDHNNIADVLTALGTAWLTGYQAPAVATAETFPRSLISTGSSAMVSGTLYCMAIGMKQNVAVSNLTFVTKGTAETGGTHLWYVLLDNAMVVRAVTSDQTGATAMTSTNTHYTFSTNSYTTTYSGLYYIGVCVVASGMPVLCALSTTAIPNDVVGLSPVLCGSSSTGQTTPPTPGTTMTALTGAQGYPFYAYTS